MHTGSPVLVDTTMISPAGASGPDNLFAAPLEGIRRGVAQAGDAAVKIAQWDVSPENMIAQLQGEVLVKANAAVLRTADEIFGALLDTKA
jgi:hypothetical protein